jgi:lysophospholipase L1-like esterase
MKQGSRGRTGEAPRSRSHILAPTPPSKRSALKRLKALASSVPRQADMVLIGDSLAAGWPSELLLAVAPGEGIFNFGLPGDRIQNTLWRLKTIGIAHLRPKQVIILLGTNNLGDGDEPEAIAAGLVAVIAAVRRLWLETSIVVISIPSRGPPPGFRDRQRVRANGLIGRAVSQTERGSLIDADLVLKTTSSQSSSVNEADLLHLSYQGYERLTVAVRDAIGARSGERLIYK